MTTTVELQNGEIIVNSREVADLIEREQRVHRLIVEADDKLDQAIEAMAEGHNASRELEACRIALEEAMDQ